MSLQNPSIPDQNNVTGNSPDQILQTLGWVGVYKTSSRTIIHTIRVYVLCLSPQKNTFIAIYTYCTFYCSIYLLSTHFSMLKIKVTWNATVIFKQTCIVYQKTMNKQSLLLKPKQCEWPTNATRPQKLELFGQVDLVSFFGCDMVGSCFQTRFFP